MKRFLLLLLWAGCSVNPLDRLRNDPFIKNLTTARLHEVDIGIDEKGADTFTVNEALPIELGRTNNIYTGDFIYHKIPYSFVRSVDSSTAIYSYIFSSRSNPTDTDPNDRSPTVFRAYIGFRLHKGGLYYLEKQEGSNPGITYESTVAWYSPANIDFNTLGPVPLYQTLGTTPSP